MRYYLIDTLPASMDDNFNVQAWNPDTRKVEAAPQFMTHLCLGMDDKGDRIDVEEIDKARFDKTIKSFGG